MRKQKRCSHFILSSLIMVFLWNGVGEGMDTNVSSPPIRPNNEKTAEESSCRFEVEVREGNFCVIRGMVHDVDLNLKPISGVCKGSANISVSGLPHGATYEILPSSKIPFVRGQETPAGTAVATVRVDTSNVTLEEMATSPLIFTASTESVTGTAKAKMTIDLPSFDFSIKLKPARLLVPQDEVATTTVNVKLLASACKSPKPITLLLDASSLPSTMSHDFSSESVTPPGTATLSFKAGSGSDTGIFKAKLLGCCVKGAEDEEREKATEVALNLLKPHPPDSGADDPFHKKLASEKDRVYSMEEYMEMGNVPEEDRKEARKQFKEESEKGYKQVPEEEIEDGMFSKIQPLLPMDQVRGILAFEPVSLKGTPFEQFHPEGGWVLPEVEGEAGGSTSSVMRAFTMPSGHRVEILEQDLFTLGGEGGKGPIIKELFNENLNGVPAMLSVVQSQNGSAISTLFWETPTTTYSINMEGNVRKNGQYPSLLEMGRSILDNTQ